ncbi:hypothetical protein UT300005_19580 [Clostridium sp. CTA-5]
MKKLKMNYKNDKTFKEGFEEFILKFNMNQRGTKFGIGYIYMECLE